MIIEIMLALAKSVLYVILAELFWGNSKKQIYIWKSVLAMFIMTIVVSIANIMQFDWLAVLAQIIVLAIMLIVGYVTTDTMRIGESAIGVMQAYTTTSAICFILGTLFGLLSEIVNKTYEEADIGMVVFAVRILVIIGIWKRYEWLQSRSQKNIAYIIMLIGSLIMFFEQFFQVALLNKNYNFAVVLILLIYLTMIFTAFMLLQHNRLTAKQQAIEEDNRQMSQRLHRSKDVLGVVSQVVASEDHIDPKLRKELADFCDDEMNEMQDRALGANLIGDTGIELVNVMLQKQMIRCADLNISFDVMIPAPIDGYIREIGISVTEFMRMLNDLLKNAVKAILSSDNTHRELLLIMGEAGNDCFEIRLYDSGVPFPPKILEHLGERGNTTDGTGNGIADTVETLRHCRASFVIEPIEPGTDIYTKCIHIAFDEQGCLPRTGEQ